MRKVLPLLVVLTLAAAAALPAEAMAASKGKRVKVSDSSYGKILVDGAGHTYYLFTRDKRRGKSRCYGECAEAWPPVITSGKPRAGKGANARKLGTTKRRGGKRQVTYNGHPLYYYVGDTRPGLIRCQAIPEFGGTWYIVAPKGAARR